MHFLCTICTEIINQDELESMYVTSCGHIFHYQCLTRWLQRSPCCPQCRKKVTKKQMFRVYPTLSDEADHDSKLTETLLNTQQHLNAQIKEKDAKILELKKDLDSRIKIIDKFEKDVTSLKSKIKKQLAQIEQQKKLTNELLNDIDFRHRNNMKKNALFNKKLVELKNKFKYQMKRNMEWRRRAKRKHVPLRENILQEGGRKRRRSTSVSDSVSNSESPIEVDSDTVSLFSESDNGIPKFGLCLA